MIDILPQLKLEILIDQTNKNSSEANQNSVDAKILTAILKKIKSFSHFFKFKQKTNALGSPRRPLKTTGSYKTIALLTLGILLIRIFRVQIQALVILYFLYILLTSDIVGQKTALSNN